MSVTIESGKRLIGHLGLIVYLLSIQSIYAFEREHGEGHVHGTHEECKLPKNSADIIACAMKMHPSAIKAQLKSGSTIKLVDKAAQIPNPTLTSRYVRGDSVEGEASELEANFNFTLELGGKRNARKEIALAKSSQANVQEYNARAMIKIATILNLHRLRQVVKEKEFLDESFKAFNKVLADIRKIPKLSSEQDASLTLFELALEELKIEESELYELEQKLEHFFHVATGHSLVEIEPFFPASPRNWPSIKPFNRVSDSPQIKELKALALVANKKSKLETAKAWPNLKIGPSLAIEQEGGVKNEMFGLNIQLPIPIMQRNDGARAFAKSEELRARRKINLAKSELKHERFEKKRIYESAVKTLKNAITTKEYALKHKKIESLYRRGVISNTIYLESFKQRFRYLKRKNKQEMTALKALWEIHLYDGNVFKEKI